MSNSVAGEGQSKDAVVGTTVSVLSPATGGMCRFTIPVLPPSVNSLHQIIYSQRKVELKPEVRRWRSDAKQYVPRVRWGSETTIIRVDVIAYYRLLTAAGKMREFDTQNLLKPLIDLIAEKQGWNDKRAKAGSWNTVDDVNERVEVQLTEVE